MSNVRCQEENRWQTGSPEVAGRLASGVAHEMNNALNAIITFAELALQAAGDDQGLRADIGEIRVAAERATDITRRLLVFSQDFAHSRHGPTLPI